MIIAIHQPEFMPWLGFFHKMMGVDAYVVLDHVQFKKRYFENRNRILRTGEPAWVSVPVRTKGKYTQAIKDVEIDNGTKWQAKLWEGIRHTYSKCPHFSTYASEVAELIQGRPYAMLLDFNMAWIEWFRSILGIAPPMTFSSSLGVADFNASGLILEICRRMGATRYYCGSSGKAYLELESFGAAGVEVVWQEFAHPSYPQAGSEFVPYLSTLDLVMNCGPASLSILAGGA